MWLNTMSNWGVCLRTRVLEDQATDPLLLCVDRSPW